MIVGREPKAETMVVTVDTEIATGPALLRLLPAEVVEMLLHLFFIGNVR